MANTISPVAGNQSFTSINTHAAQVPEVNAASVQARQVDAVIFGSGTLPDSYIPPTVPPTGSNNHEVLVSGNPIFFGDCCVEGQRPLLELKQTPPSISDNGQEITIGSVTTDPAGQPLLPKIGFFGNTPTTRPDVTSIPGLGQLMQALDQLGLIKII